MRLDKEKWRLRVNGFLTQILAPMMFTISATLYLSSLHRFVTNPKKAGTNETALQQVKSVCTMIPASHVAIYGPCIYCIA